MTPNRTTRQAASPAYPVIGLEGSLARARPLCYNDQQRYVNVNIAGRVLWIFDRRKAVAAINDCALRGGQSAGRRLLWSTDGARRPILGPGVPHQPSLNPADALAPPILPRSGALTRTTCRRPGPSPSTLGPGALDSIRSRWIAFCAPNKATLSLVAQCRRRRGGQRSPRSLSEAPVPHLPDLTLALTHSGRTLCRAAVPRSRPERVPRRSGRWSRNLAVDDHRPGPPTRKKISKLPAPVPTTHPIPAPIPSTTGTVRSAPLPDSRGCSICGS